MLKIFKFLDAISNEFSYWETIKKLQAELDTTRNELAEVNQDNYNQIIEIAKLTDQLEDARSEIADSKAAYQSLLFDYFEAAKKHREFKRESLARIEELETQVLAVTI